MCNPALVVMAFQVGMSAYGAHTDAQAQKEEMKYQESVQKNNAKISENNRMLADQQAENTRKLGETNAQNHLRQVQLTKGKQKSAMAANGLSLSEGSALSTLEDTDFMGNYDAGTIRTNAANEAWGQNISGMNYQAQANDLKTSASFSASKGKAINPGMNALTAAGATVASNWGGISGGISQAKTSYKNWQADRTIQKQIAFQGG